MKCFLIGGLVAGLLLIAWAILPSQDPNPGSVKISNPGVQEHGINAMMTGLMTADPTATLFRPQVRTGKGAAKIIVFLVVENGSNENKALAFDIRVDCYAKQGASLAIASGRIFDAGSLTIVWFDIKPFITQHGAGDYEINSALIREDGSRSDVTSGCVVF